MNRFVTKRRREILRTIFHAENSNGFAEIILNDRCCATSIVLSVMSAVIQESGLEFRVPLYMMNSRIVKFFNWLEIQGGI